MNTDTYLEDKIIRHAIYLQRLGGGYVNKLIPILEDMERELLSVVDSNAFNAINRKALLEQIRQLHLASTNRFSKEMIAMMNSLAEYEAQYTAGILTKATLATAIEPTGIALSVAVANAKIDAPVSRLTITEALAKFGRKKAVKANIVLSDALLNNLTKEEAKKALVSVLNVTKANAEALVRTSTNLVANTAKNATYLANEDIVESSEYVAKLDSRTTDICWKENTKLYPVGENPAGTLHWGCRSQAVARIKKEYARDDL